MSIEYPTLVHFRHFSSLLTNEIRFTRYASRSARTRAQKNLFMQNKPNFPRFCAKNGYLEEKQTQFKPNQTQFKANSNPIQTQSNPTCSELVEPISNHPRNSFPPYLVQRRIEFLLFYHLTFNQFFIFKFTNQQIPDFDIRRPSHQKAGFFIGGNTVSALQDQFWIQPG